MRFFKLSWKNLLRRKTRSALTPAGAAALASLLGFDRGRQNALEEKAAAMLIHAAYRRKQKPWTLFFNRNRKRDKQFLESKKGKHK